MENIEEINKEFNSKKPKKKGLILGIALLVLLNNKFFLVLSY